MNHIKNIEIKNFKSIRHQIIDDCRRVNVFIGYPNVGKSNILEALAGYSLLNVKSFKTKSLKSLIRFSRFTDLFFNAYTTEPIIITVNSEDNLIYSLSDLENLNIYITGLGKKSTIKGRPVNVRRGETYLSSSVNRDGEITFTEAMELEHTGKTLIKKYVFNSNISFQSSISLSLNIPYGENLNDIVEITPRLRKECNEILKEYNLNLHFDRTNNGNKLELRKSLSDGTTMTMDWSLIADTLRRLFFYRAAILNNKTSVLLFEEPEAHMFPPYISKFTSDVIHDENNNQYFLATHSPFIMNDLISNLEKDELSIYIVSYENETGETLIHRMDEEDINEAYQFGYDFFMNINNFVPQKEHE